MPSARRVHLSWTSFRVYADCTDRADVEEVELKLLQRLEEMYQFLYYVTLEFWKFER